MARNLLPTRLVEALALPIIAIVATALAFGALRLGRRAVQEVGTRAVRTMLVRESDQMASLSLLELDQRNGCHASGHFPFPYQSCFALASLPADSVRVSIRAEPRNRLIEPDSVVHTAVREAH